MIQLSRFVIAGIAVLCAMPCTALTQTNLTLTHKRISLRAVAGELSAVSGIPHAVDGEISDLAVTISIREMSVEKFRDRLAEVLNLTWIKVSPSKPSRKPSYVLVQAEANLRKERDLKAAEERAYRSQLDRLLDSARKGKAAIEDFAENDSRLQETLEQSCAMEAIDLLANLPVGRLDAILGNRRFILNGDQLSQGAGGVWNAYLRRAKVIRPDVARYGTNEVVAGIARFGNGVHSGISMGCDFGPANNSKLVAVNIMLDPPASFREWWDTNEMRASRSESNREINLEESVSGGQFDDLILGLASRLGVNLIAESYWQGRFPRTVYARKARVCDLFDRAMFGDQRWWQNDGVFLFQRAHWWEDREGEIPDAVFEASRKRVKQGLATLEDWSELTILSEKQWPRLQEFREMGIEFEWHPELLLYRKLSPSQRSQSRSRSLLSSSFRAKGPSPIQTWLARVTDQATVDLEGVRDLAIRIETSGNSTVFIGIAILPDGSITELVRRTVPLLPATDYKRKTSAKPTKPNK